MPKDRESIDEVTENTANATDESYKKRSKTGLTVFIVVLLVVAILTIVGDIAMHARSNRLIGQRGSIVVEQQSNMPMRGRMFVSETTTTNSSSLVSGVVTSVNGISFVLAGGGNQITVNTTGSTTWNTTDKKVSVNDSVVVVGTKSGSTLTATGVRIINQD